VSCRNITISASHRHNFHSNKVDDVIAFANEPRLYLIKLLNGRPLLRTRFANLLTLFVFQKLLGTCSTITRSLLITPQIRGSFRRLRKVESI
jgi:hypothetical protein